MITDPQLAARLQPARLLLRGRRHPALGDGERQPRPRAGAPTAGASPRSSSPRMADSSPPAATTSSASGTRTAASSATSKAFPDLAPPRRVLARRFAGDRWRLVGSRSASSTPKSGTRLRQPRRQSRPRRHPPGESEGRLPARICRCRGREEGADPRSRLTSLRRLQDVAKAPGDVERRPCRRRAEGRRMGRAREAACRQDDRRDRGRREPEPTPVTPPRPRPTPSSPLRRRLAEAVAADKLAAEALSGCQARDRQGPGRQGRRRCSIEGRGRCRRECPQHAACRRRRRQPSRRSRSSRSSGRPRFSSAARRRIELQAVAEAASAVKAAAAEGRRAGGIHRSQGTAVALAPLEAALAKATAEKAALDQPVADAKAAALVATNAANARRPPSTPRGAQNVRRRQGPRRQVGPPSAPLVAKAESLRIESEASPPRRRRRADQVGYEQPRRNKKKRIIHR